MQPLDDPRIEIRVLKFEVTNFQPHEPVRCSLINVSLNAWGASPNTDCFTKAVDLRDESLEQECPDEPSNNESRDPNPPSVGFRYEWGDFEALSYTWGDGHDTKAIILSDKWVQIPINLEAALRALSIQPETKLGMHYWVDSLCIDQHNNNEKNQQVQRMGDIYRKARAVVVWLGPEEASDITAVQKMRHLCQITPKTSQYMPSDSIRPEAWDEMCAFMDKPYWSRTWIIQELAMNHNATLILCGSLKMTRRMVLLGAVFCQQLSRRFKDQLITIGEGNLEIWTKASRMHRLVSVSFGPPRKKIMDKLLNLIRRADATDMRDKVYGILGLLDSNVSSLIVTNYDLSVRQVYTNFAVSLITSTKRLETIIFGGFSLEHGWPSWVPDWRVDFERYHVRYLKQARACGSHMTGTFRFDGVEQQHLICRGFRVDIIDGVGATSEGHAAFTPAVCTVDRYRERAPYALWRTLLLDNPDKGDAYAPNRPALLELPWVDSDEIAAGRFTLDPNSDWVGILKTSDYHELHRFRTANKDFRIGDRRLMDFFPKTDTKIKDTGSMRQLRRANLSVKARTIASTRTGYLCLVPDNAQQGDILVIFPGCRCPVILRSRQDRYVVLGECYAHGLMNGEYFDVEQDSKRRQEDFILC